ncbi:hypothetical protein [Flavobacterium sp. MMS24-S5]|uniref:hypothetical protein n=1 Tax=Flavobacterium sp. MMS24-S5 TaxID=3416605 RepID=UPI003CFECD0A
MKKYVIIIFTSLFLSCASKNPQLESTTLLKDGTSVEGLMKDPSHYVNLNNNKKKLSIKTKDGKITYTNTDIEKVTISGEDKILLPVYSNKKKGKLKYLWLTPIEITQGKASLYSLEKEVTNPRGHYMGITTIYYIWRKGENAAELFTATDVGATIGAGSFYRTTIHRFFYDCPELVKKSKDEKYKPKTNTAIDVFKEYNSICGK